MITASSVFICYPLSATCRPRPVLFLHNGKPGGRIAVASFGVVFIPCIVVGFQVEGTGAIGIDRNTRVDVGIERFIERDRGIIAVG